MALHTGEAYERDGDYFGPALNRAARLRSLADGDQILLSQAAAELVRDHLPDDAVLVDRGHRDLRGLSRGENVYDLAPVPTPTRSRDAARRSCRNCRTRLRSARPVRRPRRRVGASLTGRVGARRRRARPARVLVGGEPGVGKSRLAAEHAAARV